jgi:hypothetical protein
VEISVMTSPETNARRESIRTVLAARARSAGGSNSFAKATLDTWRQVNSQLAPVIGIGGVEVLFNRAFQQTSAVFPWLAGAVVNGESAAPIDHLITRLAGQKPATLEEASVTVLTNFAELLSTLIGESLTDRLLAPVFASPRSERRTS